MQRFVFLALAAAVFGTAACDGGSPTAAPGGSAAIIGEPDQPLLPMLPGEPIEPGDPGDPGGGGGGGGGGPYTPPVIEYRIVTNLYRSGGDMKAYTEFQRGYNGSFSRLDASSISVYCYANGAYRDGETEYNDASLVHITWGESYQYGKQITCNHAASYGGTYYSASTSFTM